MDERCIICGGTGLTRTHDYLRCPNCAHQVLAAPVGQTFIVNDPLDLSEVARANALDRFKNAMLRRWMAGNRLLVDFGCASGRFLHQNRALFGTVIGIEVTAPAVRFARERLGLDIRATAEELPESIDVLSCWHSLEHVPAAELRQVVAGLARRIGEQGRLIVSVPNAASLQYRLFGRGYAYYDVPNHHHQFTLGSLDRLMQAAGLRRVGLSYSGLYNLFGWVQGAINALALGHNYLYYRLKRASTIGSPLRTMVHAAMVLPVAVPALLGCVLDRVFSERQGVITACYEKSRC